MSTVTDPRWARTPRWARCARSWCTGPDLAHERLSPTNCHELLFDDVIWVRRARQEHDAFVDLMREPGRRGAAAPRPAGRDARGPRGARVAARAGAPAGGRHRRCSRASSPQWMAEMPADELATRLTGGVTVARAAGRDAARRSAGAARRPTSCSRHFRTSSSPATRARGSTAASRSTRCSGPPGSTRR